MGGEPQVCTKLLMTNDSTCKTKRTYVIQIVLVKSTGNLQSREVIIVGINFVLDLEKNRGLPFIKFAQ